MKKVFFFVLFAMLVCVGMAQTQNVSVERNGKNFVATKTEKAKTSSSSATKTEYSYTDTDGKTYEIYLSKNGRAYIKRVSAKTGNTYNKYLPEDVSRQICKELGVEYVEKAKK